jgi:hypothetical protein
MIPTRAKNALFKMIDMALSNKSMKDILQTLLAQKKPALMQGLFSYFKILFF